MWIFRVFSFFLFFASLSLSPLLFISPFHFFSVSSISFSVSLFLRLSFTLSCAFLCLSLLLFTCLFISFSVFFYAVPIPSLDHISMLFNMWTVYNTKEGLAIYAKCFSTPSNIFYIVFPYIDWNSLDFYFFYNIFCWIFLSIHYFVMSQALCLWSIISTYSEKKKNSRKLEISRIEAIYHDSIGI